jgi:hypothetical protein
VPNFQTPPIQGQKFLDSDEPSHAWQRWFELVKAALSNPDVPTSANSAGTPIQMQGVATDGNFLYICVGVNSWKKIPLSAL